MHLLLQNPQAREHLFSELHQLTKSAVPMPRIAEMMCQRQQPLQRAFGKALQAGLATKGTLAQAMGPSLDSMEQAVLAAADASGQIPEGMRHLAGYYQLLNQTRKQILSAVAYPVFVLHFAAVVYALLNSLSSDASMLWLSVKYIGLLWLALGAWFGLTFLLNRLAVHSTFVDAFLQMIPLSGKARKYLAMSRWCMAAHFQMLAGRNFGVAFQEGGKASQSALIQAFSEKVATQVQAAQEIGQTFLNSSTIPEQFGSGVASAEVAGRMDELLAEWCGRFLEDARMALANLAIWLPKLVFLAAALATGFIIIQQSMQRMQSLSSALDGNF